MEWMPSPFSRLVNRVATPQSSITDRPAMSLSRWPAGTASQWQTPSNAGLCFAHLLASFARVSAMPTQTGGADVPADRRFHAVAQPQQLLRGASLNQGSPRAIPSAFASGERATAQPSMLEFCGRPGYVARAAGTRFWRAGWLIWAT